MSTITDTITDQIVKLEEEIASKKRELHELRKKREPRNVVNYTFQDVNGNEIDLLSMFCDSDELILIHNMGKSCPYCTLWADEYNGVYDHLKSRAPFVVVSPDDTNTMKEFAEGRGWRFPIYSSKENSFKKDIGFESEKGMPQPGVSVFLKDSQENITEYSNAFFGPGDNFCSLWDYFDMLPSGSNGWQAKYKY